MIKVTIEADTTKEIISYMKELCNYNELESLNSNHFHTIIKNDHYINKLKEDNKELIEQSLRFEQNNIKLKQELEEKMRVINKLRDDIKTMESRRVV